MEESSAEKKRNRGSSGSSAQKGKGKLTRMTAKCNFLLHYQEYLSASPEPRSEKDERATSCEWFVVWMTQVFAWLWILIAYHELVVRFAATEKKRRKNESTTENSGTSDQRHGAAPEAPPHVVAYLFPLYRLCVFTGSATMSSLV